MATIAFRTFVDVYDDTDNYYDIILPKSLWEKLCNQFESTKEVRVETSNNPNITLITGTSGNLYGQDWWEEIEEDLLVSYAGNGCMKIVHKDCEEVANYNK